MIRNYLLLFTIVTILFSCTPGNNLTGEFTIEGSIDTIIEGGQVFLTKRENGKYIHIDTSDMENGKFHFEGYINYPERYYLQIPEPKILVPFFVEAADIDIDIISKDLNSSSIEGSSSNDEYEAYLDQLQVMDDSLRSLMKKMGKTP